MFALESIQRKSLLAGCDFSTMRQIYWPLLTPCPTGHARCVALLCLLCCCCCACVCLRRRRRFTILSSVRGSPHNNENNKTNKSAKSKLEAQQEQRQVTTKSRHLICFIHILWFFSPHSFPFSTIRFQLLFRLRCLFWALFIIICCFFVFACFNEICCLEIFFSIY